MTMPLEEKLKVLYPSDNRETREKLGKDIRSALQHGDLMWASRLALRFTPKD